MDVLHSFNLICWKKKSVSFLNLLLHLQVSAGVKAKSPVTRGSLPNLLPTPAFLWDSVGWWRPAQALDQTDVVSLLAQPFTSHITDPGPLLKWGLKHLAHRVSVSFKRVMHGKPLVSRLVLKKEMMLCFSSYCFLFRLLQLSALQPPISSTSMLFNC